MRILVIEDEHRVATAIKKGLGFENCFVDLAFDGETGWESASEGNYDLIILDLMLPKVGGMEICQRLRKQGDHTPILILSAKGELQDKISGFNFGADDYMVKPFAFEELVARVKALSKRSPSINNPLIDLGNVKIDTNNFLAIVDDKKIILTNKEYSILEYLARNANKILSKDQIMNHVWSYDANVLPNTIEATIKNIRRKLGINIIQTVRGFGYKIERNNV